MIKRLTVVCLLFVFVLSCRQEKSIDADTIVNKSILISGGELIKNSIINFDFRDKHYKAIRKDGKFQLERSFSNKTEEIKDVLNNKGFMRFVNSFPMAIIDSMAVKYSASVNSVHYFSILPFGLNDSAVMKSYIDIVEIKEKKYHKIKVTFYEEAGGEDFEDVFIYWIDTETHKVVYLAYSYSENDGVGLRFREAFNERYVNGIRFVDYNNYKPKDKNVLLENLDVLFSKNDLELLSKIELKNIKVNLN